MDGSGVSHAVANDAAIEQYLRCLRDAYTMLRKQWRPGYRGPGDRHHDKWLALAMFLFAHKADPYSYVQFVFDKMVPHAADVYVEMVTSLRLAEEFLKEIPRIQEKAKQLVYLQAEKLKRQLDSGQAMDELFASPYTEYNSVFKFAAAWSAGRRDLAEMFREGAERMMLFEPVYRTLLCKWLPKSMGGFMEG